MERSKRFWRYGFFVGIILLNVLLIFRSTAFQAGGMIRILWTAAVLFAGASLLTCLFRMREHNRRPH